MNIFLQIIFKIFLKKDNQLPLPKYVLAIVLILVVFCSTLMPEGLAKNKNTKQRSIEKIFLDIDFNGLRISESFEKIENNTQFIFSYRKSIIDDKKIRDYAMVNSSLADVLRKIGNMANLRFKRINETIHVTKYTGSEDRVKEYIGDVKKIDISGRVTDEQGEGLPGVNIIIKGTTVGTVTDTNGNYNFKVPSDETILVFSFIGFGTQEIKLGNRTILNVTLEPDIQSLDEIVVTGYHTIDRKLFTGSAAKLENKDIQLQGVPELTRSLQGQVSGVEVENVSGTFGAAPIVRVRGNASINGANKPLWVVDGIILEDAVELSNEDITNGNLATILSSSTISINPDDIESFQILKDASATALYGSRAMNGVIVITTKSNQSGEPSISFTSNVTMRSKPTYAQFSILNSGDEMEVYQELHEKAWIDVVKSNKAANHGAMSNMFRLIATDKLRWRKDGSPNYDFLKRYADANTNWFDVLFKNSLSFQNSVSVSGGSRKHNYRVSIGYFNDLGQTVADKAKNYTATIFTRHSIGEKLSLGFRLSGNIRDQQLAGSENRKFNAKTGQFERNFDVNPFNYALYTSRSVTPYHSDGKREFFRKNFAPFNIFHEVENNRVDLNLIDTKFQVDLDYKAIDNLEFKTSVQGRWYQSKSINTISENSNKASAYRNDDKLIAQVNPYLFRDPKLPNQFPYSVLPQGGFRNTKENLLTSYYLRNIIQYSPKLNERHESNVLIGHEVRYNDRLEDYFEGWGYLDREGVIISDPNFLRHLANLGIDYFYKRPTKNRAWGYFINLSYGYNEKYIINGTLRSDGDNRTGKSNQSRFLPTWNVSGGWNLHKENFMSDVGLINLLKLKATYGLSGDNPVNASANSKIMGYQPFRPHLKDREIGFEIKELSNQDFTYEKLYELNLGLEVAMLNNRIYAEVEHYRRNSKDLLGLVETNGIGGLVKKFGNVGEMVNNGVEFSIKTINIKTQNFRWTTQINFNTSSNEITKWLSNDNLGRAVSRYGANIKGYPKGALFSIPFARLDYQGIPQFYNYAKGDGTSTFQSINFARRDSLEHYLKYEGSIFPTGFGGLTNQVRYKNLTFTIGITFRYGNKIRLDDYYQPGESGMFSDYKSIPKSAVNRWSLEGDEKVTNVPSIITPHLLRSLQKRSLNPHAMYNKSDQRVADGDFVRVKNVTIAYTLPQGFVRKFKIRDASVSLSGFNLWLLYSDKRLEGIDPEFYQTGGVSLPLSSSYTFTLSVKI